MVASGLVRLLAIAWCLHQGLSSARQDQRAASELGVIAGRVLESQDSPTPNATVTVLSRKTSNQIASAITDEQGRFSFRLPVGSYRLLASKPSYVTSEYGARRPRGGGISIDLLERELVQAIDIRLERGGAINGTVWLPDQTPFGHVTVEILTQRISSSAIRSWSVAQVTRTDDRGAFSVDGLATGQYLVRVRPPAGSFITSVPDPRAALREPALFGYTPTYYPSSAVEADAQPVAVAAHSAAAEIRIQAVQVQFARVEGQLGATESTALAAADVMLRRLDMADEPVLIASRDGAKFKFRGVGPGQYLLQAAVADEQPPRSTRLVAARTLTIVGPDIDGIHLFLSRAPVVEGLVVNRSDPDLLPSALLLVPVKPSYAVASTVRVKPSTGGAFSAGLQLGGRYRLSVPPEAGSINWIVTSLAVQGQETRGDEIEVPDVGNLQTVIVNVTNRLGSVAIVVRDRAGRPRPELSVVIFPQASQLWLTPRLIRAQRPSDKGNVRFDGLPPGDYRVAVVDNPDENEWLLDTFLRTLLAHSTECIIAPGSEVAIQLIVADPKATAGSKARRTTAVRTP